MDRHVFRDVDWKMKKAGLQQDRAVVDSQIMLSRGEESGKHPKQTFTL